jgi:hypothetical protein
MGDLGNLMWGHLDEIDAPGLAYCIWCAAGARRRRSHNNGMGQDPSSITPVKAWDQRGRGASGLRPHAGTTRW